MKRAILSPRLFDGQQWHDDCCVIIEGEQIAAIVPQQQCPPGVPVVEVGNGTLAPGFIDLQVNGGGGVMLNNTPTPERVNLITQGHRPTGTTAMVPTLVSDTREVQQAGIDAVRAARDGGNHGVLGIHIEGPFFNPEKRGAHKADMIRALSEEDIDWLCSLDDLELMLTLAPEQLAKGQIQQLNAAGVRVCAGHTNASYQQLQAALAEGLRGFTHLFNAMSPLTAREPGAVGAALDDTGSWLGIIADGHHVHPASIRIAWQAKARGKLCLVTDAMATVGSDSDEFQMYGETISERDGVLVNSQGTLAGSAIGMIDAVRYAHQTVGIPLDECLRMASLYPATFLGRESQLGRIAEGYRADLVHFDANFRVKHTWVAGEHTCHK